MARGGSARWKFWGYNDSFLHGLLYRVAVPLPVAVGRHHHRHQHHNPLLPDIGYTITQVL